MVSPIGGVDPYARELHSRNDYKEVISKIGVRIRRAIRTRSLSQILKTTSTAFRRVGVFGFQLKAPALYSRAFAAPLFLWGDPAGCRWF